MLLKFKKMGAGARSRLTHLGNRNLQHHWPLELPPSACQRPETASCAACATRLAAALLFCPPLFQRCVREEVSYCLSAPLFSSGASENGSGEGTRAAKSRKKCPSESWAGCKRKTKSKRPRSSQKKTGHGSAACAFVMASRVDSLRPAFLSPLVFLSCSPAPMLRSRPPRKEHFFAKRQLRSSVPFPGLLCLLALHVHRDGHR